MNNMAMFFMNALKSGENPEQLVLKFLKAQSNPISENLLALAARGDYQGIEQVARNVCAQKGVDFDTELNSFRKTLGV